MKMEPPALVVFDGDCGLCNGFVAWLIRRDRHDRFHIAGSGGEVGRAALESMGLAPEVAESTLVVATVDGPRLRSDAVVAVASRLPWPWRGAAAIRVVPRRVRDRMYSAVAARRPRRPADDPACGTPPAGMVERWRRKLATLDDLAALTSARSATH